MTERKKDRKRKGRINKYRVVLYSADTYEEHSSFKIRRNDIITIAVSAVILIIVLTTCLIAFTPIREYIPGYTDMDLYKRMYELERRTDSIETASNQKDLYLKNIKRIVMGDDFADDSINSLTSKTISKSELQSIRLKKSEQDSILRTSFESETQYSLFDNIDMRRKLSEVRNFFVPLDGVVTSRFNRSENHFGIDIVANNNEIIKNILDGTVVFADWTINNGYVIGIQHTDNIFSVYKHNSSLLKKEGDFVKSGEAIAYFGETGELSTGPHLHFELWIDGMPVNPEEYIMFENNK